MTKSDDQWDWGTMDKSALPKHIQTLVELAEVAEPQANSPREEVLQTAYKAVTQERNNSYGPPTQDFTRIAGMATELGFSFNGEPLKGHNVAQFMILMKLSRSVWSPEVQDHWVDTSGYSACGYECVVSTDG